MSVIEQIIVAMLSEAKQQDSSSVLRTSLVKYVYLLDVYTAEETQGIPFSNLQWKFVHFGPYSSNLQTALDSLSERNIIASYSTGREVDGKEYCTYSLKTGSRSTSLKEIGVSAGVSLRVVSDIRRFRKSLPKLLEYVYFETTPMKNAEPGTVLEFENCEKLNFQKTEMKSLSKKKVKKTLEKIRGIIKENKSQEIAEESQSLYDKVYFDAMELANEEPLEAGLNGSVKLD